MSGGNDENKLIEEEGLGLDIAAARGALDEAKRDPLLLDRGDDLLGVAAGQCERDAGMLAAEVAEDAGQDVLRDGGGGAESKLAGVISARRGDGLLGLGEQRMHLRCVAKQEPAGGGESDVRAGAIEELNVEVFFKSLDLQADRGLSQEKVLSRLAEAEMLG